MYHTLLVIFILVAIALIALIMFQQGESADVGGSFNVGTSGTFFGSSNSNKFIIRMTAMLAALFFILSLVLGNFSRNYSQKGSQWDNLYQDKQNKADKVAEEKQVLQKENNDIPE